VHVDPDVLLIDEVLAVGDGRFHRKCEERIHQFRREGKTILLVSHDLAAVGALCDRVVWMSQGEKRMEGPPKEVIPDYVKWISENDDGSG
jgi:ABC-type polysaccharide/polyol phosphate transport system ATPase subunit